MGRSIVLVGPMGSGKTTLGKKLAKEIGLPFLDTDKAIASKHGAITRIFEQHGEEYFRELESIQLETALQTKSVVSTGGGAVLRERNRTLMSDHFVIFLDTSSEHVLGKINLSKRPLLKSNPEKWQEIYDSRVELYKSIADHQIFTGGHGIKFLLSEIRKVVPND